MADRKSAGLLCRGVAGDTELQRIQVWEDALWRLTLSLEAEVLGFAYLEPKRHIPHITDLEGAEARTFGEVLVRVTHVLRDETGAFWLMAISCFSVKAATIAPECQPASEHIALWASFDPR